MNILFSVRRSLVHWGSADVVQNTGAYLKSFSIWANAPQLLGGLTLQSAGARRSISHPAPGARYIELGSAASRKWELHCLQKHSELNDSTDGRHRTGG